MKLTLERIYTCPTYTIGHLYINGMYVCDTIEDCDRRLSDSMTEAQIKSIKVYGKTAIPYGSYDIAMNIKSPKFSTKAYYQNLCNGCLPRLQKVKGYEGVLIHTGNTADDSYGCILVGYNKAKGKVLYSKDAFTKIMKQYLLPAKSRNERIFITIKEVYK